MTDNQKKRVNKNGETQGMHPNSQKNLGRGRMGNNHANKDYSITRIVKEMLDQPAVDRWLEVEDKGTQLTWRQAIAKRLLIEAVKGNSRIIGDLLDRLEGKVTQVIGGDPDQPIVIKVVYEGDDAAE